MLYEHAFTVRRPVKSRHARLPAGAVPARPLKQAVDAGQLLFALREHVLARREPLHGYARAAALIARDRSESAHLRQVCRRIDLACHLAGLPLLTLHWVRRPGGEINHEALAGWRADARELAGAACAHDWCAADFDAVERQLAALPDRSAAALWRAIESEGSAAIRRQLLDAPRAR